MESHKFHVSSYLQAFSIYFMALRNTVKVFLGASERLLNRAFTEANPKMPGFLFRNMGMVKLMDLLEITNISNMFFFNEHVPLSRWIV